MFIIPVLKPEVLDGHIAELQTELQTGLLLFCVYYHVISEYNPGKKGKIDSVL